MPSAIQGPGEKGPPGSCKPLLPAAGRKDIACPKLMPWTALHQLPQPVLRLKWRRAMGQITTIGLDIAKSIFQVHGVDATGEVILRRRLTRARVVSFFEKLAPCLVGIEACAT